MKQQKIKKNHSSFYTINFINLSNILISYGISFPNSICALMVGKYINKEKSLLNTCKILLRFFVELFFIKYFKMYLMRLSSHILGQLTSLNPPDLSRTAKRTISVFLMTYPLVPSSRATCDFGVPDLSTPYRADWIWETY